MTRTQKPWGYFEQFTNNLESTVKLLYIKEGASLSLQTHKERDELWYIIEGEGVAILEEELHELFPGDSFYVPKGKKHRYTAKTDTRILEISTGYFDETDIERFEDKYGRVKK